MASRDKKKPSPSGTPLARLHISGVIIPHWWRKQYVIVLTVAALLSVIIAISVLFGVEQRIAQPDAPLLPDVTENVDQAPIRAYEEALPQDMYEQAPVNPTYTPPVPNPNGPRISVPEEFIPQPATIQKSAPASVPATLSTSLQKTEPAPAQTGTELKSDTTSPLETAVLSKDAPDAQPDIMLDTWQRNALPFELPTDRPMIAIVIDDMGVDRRRSPHAIALPGPLTMSFLTYAGDIRAQAAAARNAGHELMLHVAMEPGSSTIDPGPNVLRVDDSAEKTLARLRWGLEKFDGYVGVNNHMGSKFTQNDAGMRVVIAEMKARGLLFLDSRTAGGTVSAQLAQEYGVPFATRNVFIDHVDDAEEIRRRLAETERLALKNGAAVAIGHPRDATINMLAQWLPTLIEKGIVLAPLSAIVRQNWQAKN